MRISRRPCHTTHHAGPHRTVRKIEVTQLAVLAWAARSLDHIGLLDPIVSVGGDILATKLERGSISVSIEDILAFGLRIWVSFLLSRLIRYPL